MTKFFSTILFLFYTLISFAQAPESYNSSRIYEQLKKLNVLGSVLYIAAHPDDENTKLLAWLANDKLYRTGYLSVTRGDGGQNLIGDEQGVALGLIRTQELLAARRIDGAEQFFTRAFDFGYSKSPEEALDKWGKENILSDMVWVIRKFKPDVIITRFPTTGEGGHGHHTASAILAGEAFEAAANPERFKEQFKFGVKPWKTKRLLWNTFNFGGTNTQRPDQFKIDVGGYNPLLGKSYGELAAESRSQHKSQGFGVASTRGNSFEYFVTIKGEAPVKDIMDNVHTDWSSNNQKALQVAIDEVIKNYSFVHPDRSLGGLINIYQYLRKNPEGYWQSQKLEEIKGILKACAGLYFEVSSQKKYAVPGDSMRVNIVANKRSGGAINIESVKIQNTFFVLKDVLARNENVSHSVNIPIPERAKISQPYWLENPKELGYFVVADQRLIGKPWNDPEVAEINVKFNGENILYKVPIQYKSIDPVMGEKYQPLLIIPKFEVETDPVIALAINNTPVKVAVNSTTNTVNSLTDTIEEVIPKNILETKESNGNYYSFTDFNKQNKGIIKGSAVAGNNVFDSYKTVIEYEHIPEIIYFSKAATDLVGIDLSIAGKRVGYIAGAGDKVPEALHKMGYEVVMLNEHNITPQNLKGLDAIVTGVRAYNIHKWLNDSYDVLMNYVKEGGVLLVQYNTNNNFGPLKAKIGPFPFNISRTRITDENAAVSFLKAGSPFLNYPNKISATDFKGWIQERSIYHAADFGSNYQTLFSMQDPGEGEEVGSLIYTDFGKGRFIYTGLVFFRELPAGVPGAYRLFANLLAKPE